MATTIGTAGMTVLRLRISRDIISLRSGFGQELSFDSSFQFTDRKSSAKAID